MCAWSRVPRTPCALAPRRSLCLHVGVAWGVVASYRCVGATGYVASSYVLWKRRNDTEEAVQGAEHAVGAGAGAKATMPAEAGESKDDTLPEAQTKTTTRTDIFDKSQAPEIAPTTPTLLFDLHALDISDLDPPKSDSTAQRIFSIYLFEPTFDRGNCAKSEKE